MKLGTSQNGWPVYDETSHYTYLKVEGVNFWAANADVATVLGDFTQRFHDTIESITLPVSEAPGRDDWSFAVRPVRGQTRGYSNHGSATAWDLNATRHPRGVRNTYSATQRSKLRALVDSYDGVLRHGEFYTSSPVDGMHVEIDDDAAAVRAMATKIRIRNTPREVDPLMADKISSANLEAIASAVWNSDRIPVNGDDGKPADPANPTWQADSVLTQVLHVVTVLRSELAELRKDVDALTGPPPAAAKPAPKP